MITDATLHHRQKNSSESTRAFRAHLATRPSHPAMHLFESPGGLVPEAAAVGVTATRGRQKQPRRCGRVQFLTLLGGRRVRARSKVDQPPFTCCGVGPDL